MNQHAAIRVAKPAIQRVLATLALCPGLEVDEQLKLSMLEGETELSEIVSALLSDNENDEGLIAAIGSQIEARRERKSRLERRIEARKAAIVSLMDCARLTKLPLAEATLSIRTYLPRPKVVDVSILPDSFVVEEIVRKPNNEAINEAFEKGQIPPGVVLTNGSASLSVRRK